MEETIKELSNLLGYEIGTRLSDNLPTLSCDSMKSFNVIQVTYGEAQVIYKLEEIWYDGCADEVANKPNWITLQSERKRIEDKYLPRFFEFHNLGNLPKGIDMDEFKSGVSSAIWDCDLSHYSSDVENIEVTQDKYGINIKVKIV